MNDTNCIGHVTNFLFCKQRSSVRRWRCQATGRWAQRWWFTVRWWRRRVIVGLSCLMETWVRLSNVWMETTQSPGMAPLTTANVTTITQLHNINLLTRFLWCAVESLGEESSKARFPSKRNRLRWQTANHGCHCFDRASYCLLLAANRMLGRSSGNHDWLACVLPGFHPNAMHAMQAIAFGWKPGLRYLWNSWKFVVQRYMWS